MTTQQVSLVSQTTERKWFPAMFSLLSILLFCGLSLPAGYSHAHSTVDWAAFGGLLMMGFGTSTMMISHLFKRRPSLQRKIELFASGLLINGGISYLIPLSTIIYNVWVDSCIKRNSDVPCFYHLYYESIAIFIPIKALIVGHLVLMQSYQLLQKLVILGLEYWVGAGYMLVFINDWYMYNDNNNAAIWFKYTVIAYFIVIFIPLFTSIAYGCYKGGWIGNNSGKLRHLAFVSAALMIISGFFIFFGSFYAGLVRNFFGKYLIDRYLFGYYIFGTSIAAGCEIYSFLLVWIAITKLQNVDSPERSGDDEIDVSIIDNDSYNVNNNSSNYSICSNIDDSAYYAKMNGAIV